MPLTNQLYNDKTLAILKSAARAIGGKPLSHDEITLSADSNALGVLRGQVDMAGLRVLYHDINLNKSFIPKDTKTRIIFERAEEARIGALGARRYKGVAANINCGIEVVMARFIQIPDLADYIYLAVYYVLTNAKTNLSYGVADIDDLIYPMLLRLPKLVYDQRQFAEVILELLALLKPLLNDEEEKITGSEADKNYSEPVTDDQANLSDQSAKKTYNLKQELISAEENTDRSKYTEASYVEQTETQNLVQANKINEYKIFTSEYDEIVHAHNLCNYNDLARLRKSIDIELAELKNITQIKANQFLRKLLSKKRYWYETNLEEGKLDNNKLARIIAGPNYLACYKREKQSDYADTIVGLLIDNSGSMRGRAIKIAAMCADILAKTMEKCAIKTEILGFTTKEWQGGQARKSWFKQGKQANPGRLNDLRHIIYKHADASWHKARVNLGLMLKEGILKENIDGEAIIWAAKRLRSCKQARKILVVVSDGAPVDDSTLSLNGGDYLDKHLRNITSWLESRADIELIAIGIGHDVGRYYSNAVTIDNAEQLGDTLFHELGKLF